MGFEYKLAFQIADPTEVESFLDRLRAELAEAGDAGHFTVSLEPDGFYFCDHTKSAGSSVVFRKLIDEALMHSKVIVYEL